VILVHALMSKPTAILQSVHTIKIQVAPIQVNTSAMLQLSWSFTVIFKFFVLSSHRRIWWCSTGVLYGRASCCVTLSLFRKLPVFLSYFLTIAAFLVAPSELLKLWNTYYDLYMNSLFNDTALALRLSIHIGLLKRLWALANSNLTFC